MQIMKFGNVLDLESSWKSVLCSHTEQLLQKYPDYKPDEYIFWIESSILLSFQYRVMSAQILLKDNNGNLIQKLLLTRDFKTGKPYPNKSVVQMRLINGRGSVFGIPLRFKTFDELARIKHIDIMWDIGFEIGEEFHYSLTTVKYEVDFIHHEHKRIYTLEESSVCNIMEKNDEKSMHHFECWLQKFDQVINNIFKQDLLLSDSQISIIDRNRVNSVYHADVSWFVTECISKKKIESTDFGAFFDEPRFGFKHIMESNYHNYQKFIDYHEKYY